MKNCKEHGIEHRWPKTSPGGDIRSIGNVRHHQCNNCLATKLIFETDIYVDEKWVRITDTQVIEPNFKK
jgi:hypothetical protein